MITPLRDILTVDRTNEIYGYMGKEHEKIEGRLYKTESSSWWNTVVISTFVTSTVPDDSKMYGTMCLLDDRICDVLLK